MTNFSNDFDEKRYYANELGQLRVTAFASIMVALLSVIISILMFVGYRAEARNQQNEIKKLEERTAQVEQELKELDRTQTVLDDSAVNTILENILGGTYY